MSEMRVRRSGPEATRDPGRMAAANPGTFLELVIRDREGGRYCIMATCEPDC